MRPNQLATEIGISPKKVRGWLRCEYPRMTSQHGESWELTDDQVAAARRRFISGASTLRQTMPQADQTHQSPRRDGSDEAYVIDLCDEILCQTALRQHRFAWLRGDPGRESRTVCLPLDAYYRELGLVIEYRERQHDEAVPHFDKRQTIRGVDRRDQRRIYDQRREVEIPKHGIRLIIIRPAQLSVKSRGRLRRDRQADLRLLRVLLAS